MSEKSICPVMSTPVDTKQARSKRMVREYNGKKYYLCCQTCVKLFDKKPASYAGGKELSQ